MDSGEDNRRRDMKEFEEKCHICGKYKMVHDDMMTNLGNPGFVCDECERKRDRVLCELFKPEEDVR